MEAKIPLIRKTTTRTTIPAEENIVHYLQLPSFEKLVNVIDIEDEDDSDFEDYLPACLLRKTDAQCMASTLRRKIEVSTSSYDAVK